MLTVTKFEVHPLTQVTDIELVFTVSGRTVLDKQSFFKPENARYYIRTSKMDVLKRRVENFVNHCAIIMETSDYDAGNIRRHAMGRCREYVKWAVFQNPTLEDMCRFFLQVKNFFREILPYYKNNSYASSLSDLAQITTFCQDQLTELKIKKAA